ncbi:MAG: nucleotidyltransferase domain-containing protein [Candidatus Delongbacteria bacterium]|nr:nucleotidyltransferase domain-containing protein [Candidatus Delongbacteria bacterium]
MNEINKYIEKIRALCEINRVKTLYLFGSFAKGDFTDQSDIDFIVELLDTDPIEYADHYFNLKYELKSLLKRHIDLLEKKAIKNPYLINQIEQSKVAIYAN